MSEWRDDGEHLWLPMIVELLLSIWLMRMWQSFVLRAPLTSWLMMDLLTPLTIRPFGHHYFHLYLHPLHLHLQVNKIGNIKMCGIRKSTWYKSLVKAKKKKRRKINDNGWTESSSMSERLVWCYTSHWKENRFFHSFRYAIVVWFQLSKDQGSSLEK